MVVECVGNIKHREAHTRETKEVKTKKEEEAEEEDEEEERGEERRVRRIHVKGEEGSRLEGGKARSERNAPFAQSFTASSYFLFLFTPSLSLLLLLRWHRPITFFIIFFIIFFQVILRGTFSLFYV